VTPKQKRYTYHQEKLGKSLAKHFDGDFLSWTTFPNNNYNKENPYNVKAAAFEEAIKKGYKQILWVDCPVIALKSVSPIFDSIHKNGYLTMKNSNFNCAQTCSDACLAYFKVTRDQAEKFQEHASGVIGIDMENPKGKKLIEKFIKACKDGACDGSREHDGQSNDPRFKFHRQDQSVISLAANTLGLNYTMVWDNELISLYPERVKDKEKIILTWTNRTLANKAKRSTRRKLHRGGTRKIDNETESYIYLIARCGFNDMLSQLDDCTQYAIKHKRSIILEFKTYSATDLATVFDFSNFPVPVYLNYKEKLDELADKPIEPRAYGKLTNNFTYNNISKNPVKFNIKHTYPRDTVLIYSHITKVRWNKHRYNSIRTLSRMKFTQDFLKMYNDFKKKYNIPEIYKAAHLRATDRKLLLRGISGIKSENSNNILRGENLMESIDRFIQYKEEIPTYIASDKTELLKSLIHKHPNVINTNPDERIQGCNKEKCPSLHHPRGRTDPNNLKDALIDLLILAGAKILMITDGGFSQLAKDLRAQPDILKNLLS